MHLYLKKSHFNFFPHSVCWLKIPMMNLVGFYKTKSVERGLKVINLLFQPFDSQDLISNSPYCLPNNSFDVSSEKLDIGSTYNPLIDIFLYSHHFSAWYCTDIVERNSVLVTYGVKGSSEPRVMWSFSLFTCLTASCSLRSLTISSGIWRTTLLLFARISWTTGNVRHFNNSDYFFFNSLTIFAQGTESLIWIFRQDFRTAPYNCKTKVIYCFRHRFLSVIQDMYA